MCHKKGQKRKEGKGEENNFLKPFLGKKVRSGASHTTNTKRTKKRIGFKSPKFTMISTTSAQNTTKAIQTKFVTKHKFGQNKTLPNRENAEETTKQPQIEKHLSQPDIS